MTTHRLELVKFGDPFENEVVEHIASESEDVLDDGMLNIAITLLADDRPDVRAAALNVLAECGSSWPLEQEIAVGVLRCLGDGEPLVRRAALRVARLTIRSDGCKSFVYDLIRCIGDRDSGNRDAAIELLIEEFTGAFDFEHCLVLAEYVAHPDSVTRGAAREMLVTAGQEELVRRCNDSVVGSEAARC
jgi:hypothetical protein